VESAGGQDPRWRLAAAALSRRTWRGKIYAETSYFIPAMKEPARLIKAGKEPPAHVELFVKAMEYQTTVNYTENTERARQIYRPELELVYTCKARADDILTKVRPLVEDALVGKY